MNFQFMTDAFASISKIFSLTNYDLKNNAKKWIGLICLQALVVAVLNLHAFLPGTVEVFVIDFFDYMGSFELGIGQEYLLLGLNLESLLMLFKFIIVFVTEVCLHILFPIMILQNALDLAFDSQMRGFKIKGPLFSYVFTIAFLVISRNIILDYSEFFLEMFSSVMQNSITLSIVFLMVSFIISFSYLYLFQRIRFTGLHILEYRSGVLKAIQASYVMTQNNIFFLFLISIIQILILLGFDLIGSYCTELGFFVFNKFVMLFPFDLISSPLFTFGLSNIVLMLSMIFSSLVMVLFFSVEAHVYRQVVCPVNEKSACESCECGS